MQRVNRYQKSVTFQLVSVEDLLEKVAEAQEEVYGYADGDSDNSSMDGADIDWAFLFTLGFIFVCQWWSQISRVIKILLLKMTFLYIILL